MIHKRVRSNDVDVRFFAIIFTAVCLVLTASVAPGYAQQKRVLEVWDFWSTSDHRLLFDDVKERFEKENPGVEVRYSIFPGGVAQFRERMITAFATGDAPDVAQASVGFVRDLYDAGFLLPLNPYVDGTPAMQLNQFFPNTHVYVEDKGTLFGIPLVLDTNVLIKNIGFLEEAGLDHSPHGIDTWDSFIDYSLKLTRYNESGNTVRSGYHASVTRGEWAAWIYSNGGRIYNESYSGFDIATEEVAGTTEFLLDLRNRDQIAPSGSGNAFTAGRTAMIVTGAHLPLTALQESPSLKLIETTLPVGPLGSERAAVGWGNMMVITKDTKDPDLAWDFLTFYAGLEGQKLIAQHLGRPGIPRFDFYHTDVWYGMIGENPWMVALPEIYQSAQTYTSLFQPSEVNRMIDEFMALMRQGETDPRSALEELERVLTSVVEF